METHREPPVVINLSKEADHQTGKEKTIKEFSSVDEHYKLWVLLAQTRDAILKVRRKEMLRYKISEGQWCVLVTIQAIGNKATPAEISRWLLREPHSVSELVSRMEMSGLVRKVKDLRMKNQVRVLLTEKGYEAYQIQLSKRGCIRKIMSSLSAEECRQLKSFLKRLQNKALKELGIEPETRSGLPQNL